MQKFVIVSMGMHGNAGYITFPHLPISLAVLCQAASSEKKFRQIILAEVLTSGRPDANIH